MSMCDFRLCIYQNFGVCTLKSIDINGSGLCDSAIVVNISDNVLFNYKQKHLRDLEKRSVNLSDNENMPKTST